MRQTFHGLKAVSAGLYHQSHNEKGKCGSSVLGIEKQLWEQTIQKWQNPSSTPKQAGQMCQGVMCVFRHHKCDSLWKPLTQDPEGSPSQIEEEQLLTQTSLILNLPSSRNTNLGCPVPPSGHPRALACSLSQINFYNFSCLIKKIILYVCVWGLTLPEFGGYV